MTDLSTVVPLRYKTIVGLIGSVLSFAVPLIVSVEQYLPSPWPAVIGAVLSLLTALGIYKVPYAPAGTVLVPQSVASQAPPAPGEFQNPWK